MLVRKFVNRQPWLLQHLRQLSKPSNTPHPPKDPPDEGYAPASVEHDGFDVPGFIRPAAFRQFSSPTEQLGPSAGKLTQYKNGHYFGYHRFSFVELQNLSLEFRDDRRLAGGVLTSVEEDPDDEECELCTEKLKELEDKCVEQITAQLKEECEKRAKEEAKCKEREEKKAKQLQEECKKKQLEAEKAEAEAAKKCEESKKAEDNKESKPTTSPTDDCKKD